MSWFLILAYINLWGLLGLSAAMQKHQKQIFGHHLTEKHTRFWQVLGWLGIFISSFLAVWHTNWSIGLSHIFGIITLNALLITWCLNYYPTKLLKAIYALGGVFVIAVGVYLFK